MSDVAHGPQVPYYICGLANTQRQTGSLCGKQHCQGCAPYRLNTEMAAIRRSPAPGRTQAPVVALATVEAGYVSRLEHEVAMARAVREASERLRANRRDLFISAAVQALLSTTKYSIADVARLSVECANAVVKIDPSEPVEK